MIVDRSEFELIDKAHQPGFVFENHFLKNNILDFDLGKIDWETKLHDIYEPQFTTIINSTGIKLDSSIKEKTKFGVKYSFQQAEHKKHSGGLDYF